MNDLAADTRRDPKPREPRREDVEARAATRRLMLPERHPNRQPLGPLLPTEAAE